MSVHSSYYWPDVNKLAEKGGKKASPPQICPAQKFVPIFVLFCAGMCRFVPFFAVFPFFSGPTAAHPQICTLIVTS